MIFDYDLDRAIWAMLAGNSEYRNDIAYFFKTLPLELINEVIRALEDKKHGFFDRKNYENRYYKNGNFDYKYSIDIVNSTLMLNVIRYNTYFSKTDNKEHILHEERFTLNLNMLYPALTRNVDREYIGNFSAMSSKVNFENDVYKGVTMKQICANYELIGNLFGTFVKTTDCNSINLSSVNFDKRCPKELYRTDLSTDDRVLNLVKSKKKRG